MHARVTLYPYATVSYRKPRSSPAVYTPDIQLVAQRCRARGGEEDAVALLPDIFSTGLSEDALTRKMTRDDARKYPGRAPTQAYRMLLRGDTAGRSHCRLCPIGANANGWKNARDVLRHLKRDHFGLARGCTRWYVHAIHAQCHFNLLT